MSSLPIRGAALPVRPEVRWYWTVAVRTSRITAVLLGPVYFGVWLHWSKNDKREIPCADPVNGCDLCSEGSRWRGFVAAYCETHPRVGLVVLSLTEYAARQLQDDLDHPDGLRGIRLVLERERDERTGRPKEKGKVLVVEKKRVGKLEKLPPDFDIMPSLAHLQRRGQHFTRPGSNRERFMRRTESYSPDRGAWLPPDDSDIPA